MIDAQQFRATVGSFASGVTVVTLRDPSGLPLGFTANAFTSVSLDPPLVLVCLNRASDSHDAMRRADTAFAVSILAGGQGALARRFAGKGGATKFAGVAHADGRLGVPVLEGALAVLECVARAAFDGGDHTIVLGEVRHLDVDEEAQPLVYYRGRFTALGRSASVAA